MRRSTTVQKAVASVTLTLLITACNSLKKPTKENFTRGLNEYFSAHDDCLYPGGLRFPYEVSVKGDSAATAKGLDALVGAGLLQREEEKAIQVKRYVMSTFATKHASPKFCYGHREVTSIDSFTPPANVNGQQSTQVEYHYKMMDVPGWAQSDQMLAAFPALAKSTQGQPQDTARMVLTVNGWQVPE